MDYLEVTKMLFVYEDIALSLHRQWEPTLYSLPNCVNPSDRQEEVFEKIEKLIEDEESKEYYKNLVLAVDTLERVLTKHLIHVQSKYVSRKDS